MEWWPLWTASLAVLVGAWNTVKSWFHQCQLVIFDEVVTETSNFAMHTQLLMAIDRSWHRVSWAARYVAKNRIYVAGLPPYVLAEMPAPYKNQNTVIYRQGWTPLWVTSTDARLTLRALRGTVNLTQLLMDAVHATPEYVAADEQQSDSQKLRTVHYSLNVHGNAGDKSRRSTPGRDALNNSGRSYPPGSTEASQREREDEIAASVLRGSWPSMNIAASQLDAAQAKGAARLPRLALTDTMLAAKADMQEWLRSREWYRKRAIPWRRGWLLHGAPGNGKTTFVEVMAEELALPLHRYDIASFTNEDIGKMSTADPAAILLFDDIDCVFSGRKNVSGIEDSLTFDAFLRWLDSPQREGSFVVLTTNFIEKLDLALSDRPGRIDHVYEISHPNAPGRRKVAEHIMGHDHPDLEKQLAAWQNDEQAGKPPTAATVTEVARTLALHHYWKTRQN